MKNLALSILFLLIPSIVYAGGSSPALQGRYDYVIPAPPKTTDSQNLYQYLNTIWSEWNIAQVTTTVPNGNMTGQYGAFNVYYDGTNYWWGVQTAQPSGTTWVQTQLTPSGTSGLPFSSQNVVTGSRAIGSVYHNTTGKTMFVSAVITSLPASSATAYSDSSPSPSTVVGGISIGTGSQAMYSAVPFMVLSGNYYTITQTVGTVILDGWTEWY